MDFYGTHMTEQKTLSQSSSHQVSAPKPRSSGSRINISQSLAYARAGRVGSQPEESNGRRDLNQPPTSAAPAPTPSPKIDLATIFSSVDLSPTSAKAQYLNPPPPKKPAQVSPTLPTQPSVATQSYTPAPETGLSVEEELFALSQSLRSHDSDDPDASEHEAAAVMQELISLADKYVRFFEQQGGDKYTPESRDAKIRELARFYSAPSRKGRLQALVNEL